MRANPGGEIASGDVVGRDSFIESLWNSLERQSVLLVAERRLGKTTIIKKMQRQTPEGVQAFYRDVEHLGTPLEFIERVYQDVQHCLSRRQRAGTAVKNFLRDVAGFELGGVIKFPESTSTHWKELLERVFDDLCRDENESFVMFWDELPLYIHKIKQSSGETVAMDFLDTLRSLRHTHSNLRMVFTGSIGLHHVLSSLRAAGHVNDATNDMQTVEVTAFSTENARALATELLRGERVECDDEDSTAQAICTAVDNMPFYIHAIVSAMASRNERVNASVAKELVREALVDDQDRWHLQHYYDRLPEYYGKERLPVIHAILDELASSSDSLSQQDLTKRLSASLHRELGETACSILDGDKAPLLEILRLLRRDHYVTQRASNAEFEFRGTLLKRWWKASRGL